MKVTVTYMIPPDARESVFTGIRADNANGDLKGILDWVYACDARPISVAVE